jgi:hypothetical protein
MGKNHANSLGAAAATGRLLLFTDADVMFAPDTLDRAVAAFTRRGLDHLTLAPVTTMPGLLNQFTLYFGLLFSLVTRPWDASNPRRRAHVGIGAFNMVSADLYRAVGGHERIRLRPDDDLKLGKLLKQGGARQELMVGRGFLTVEWYGSWGALRRGLMKNLYAGADYRTWLIALGVATNIVFLVLPGVLVFWTRGVAFWLNAGCYALCVLQGAVASKSFGTSRWAGLLLPLFGLFGAYLLARATWLSLSSGEIEWRDTRYRLASLRKNVV